MSRIADWIVMTPCPTYELRRKGESVDIWEWPHDSFLADLVDAEVAIDVESQFDKYAQWDTDEEGKAQSYQIYGIAKDGELHRCPIQIRKRPETNSKLLEILVRQNTELHKIVVDGQKNITRQLQELNKASNERVRQLESDRKETFDLLERLRTKSLERDLMREEHDKKLENQDRLLDAGLPVLAAIGAKLTKQLPAPDQRVNAIKQIAKGMTESQVDRISEILPDDDTRKRIGLMLANAVEGHINPDEFISVIRGLPPSTLIALRSVLNAGQAVAVQTLLEAS